MSKTKNEQLNELLAQNYMDLKAKILTFGKERIFQNARNISALEDVLFYLSTHDWLNEDEAAYLLTMDWPLVAMAAAWTEYQDDEAVNFRQVLNCLLGPDDGDDYDYFDAEPDDDLCDEPDWRSVFGE